MVGNPKSPLLRFGLAFFLLLGTAIFLCWNLQSLSRVRALSFLLLPSIPILAVYALPTGTGSFRNLILFSLASSGAFLVVLVPVYRLAGLDWASIFPFLLLSASVVLFSLGLSRLLSKSSAGENSSLSALLALELLLIGGVWLAPYLHSAMAERAWFCLNPLAALCDAISYDWIHDSELYFSSQSEFPIRYPDWRWYCALAAGGGVLLFMLSKACRSSEKEPKKENGQ